MAIINEVFELAFICRLGTQNIVNVVHMQCTNVVGVSPTDKEIVDRFSSDMSGKYKDIFSNLCRYEGARMRAIKPNPREAVVSTVGNGPGNHASESLPGQACGLIAWTTGVASRMARGRTYLPPPAEDNNVSSGMPDALARQNITSWGVALSTPWTISPAAGVSASFKLCIYSRKLASPFHVIAFTTRLAYATQRRRSQVNRPDQAPTITLLPLVVSAPSVSPPVQPSP